MESCDQMQTRETQLPSYRNGFASKRLYCALPDRPQLERWEIQAEVSDEAVSAAAHGDQNIYSLVTEDIPAWLTVTICFTPPSRNLTTGETMLVKRHLENLIMETDSTKPLPAFREYSQIIDGSVRVCCENDYSLSWLTLNVLTIRLPDTNRTLTVMRQSDVPTRVRAALFVPRYKGDVARLQNILIRQNTWHDIGRWSLFRATSVGGDKYGTYLTLEIPADEVSKVLGRERRISYLLGSIDLRFFPETAHSDVKSDRTEATGPSQSNKTKT